MAPRSRIYRRSVRRGREARKAAGNSSKDGSSLKNAGMLKYDEKYRIKSRTGNVPTRDKQRHEKVETVI